MLLYKEQDFFNYGAWVESEYRCTKAYQNVVKDVLFPTMQMSRDII